MDYKDYSREEEGHPIGYKVPHRTDTTFPEKLHVALESAEQDGNDDVLSWQPHGRAFRVHDTDQLTERVLKL